MPREADVPGGQADRADGLDRPSGVQPTPARPREMGGESGFAQVGQGEQEPVQRLAGDLGQGLRQGFR